MIRKEFEGVDISKHSEYPITIWNKKKKQWEIYMIKIGNTFYVSEKTYSKLIKELKE